MKLLSSGVERKEEACQGSSLGFTAQQNDSL